MFTFTLYKLPFIIYNCHFEAERVYHNNMHAKLSRECREKSFFRIVLFGSRLLIIFGDHPQVPVEFVQPNESVCGQKN